MKLLLAVDGSAPSQKAVRTAIRLAKSFADAPGIVLFHADPPLMQMAAAKMGMEAVVRYHRENGEGATQKATRALKRSGLECERVLTVADPAAAILKSAKATRSDLVVMGSKGHSALQAVFVGSVTAKVLSQATVPVLVVR